jgi:hypothetical protein
LGQYLAKHPHLEDFVRSPTCALVQVESDVIVPVEVVSDYDQHSNQPQTNDISHTSPYLHFGQISPLFLVWYKVEGAGRMHAI